MTYTLVWRCTRCRRKGMIEADSTERQRAMAREVLGRHRVAYPDCAARPTEILVEFFEPTETPLVRPA